MNHICSVLNDISIFNFPINTCFRESQLSYSIKLNADFNQLDRFVLSHDEFILPENIIRSFHDISLFDSAEKINKYAYYIDTFGLDVLRPGNVTDNDIMFDYNLLFDDFMTHLESEVYFSGFLRFSDVDSSFFWLNVDTIDYILKRKISQIPSMLDFHQKICSPEVTPAKIDQFIVSFDSELSLFLQHNYDRYLSSIISDYVEELNYRNKFLQTYILPISKFTEVNSHRLSIFWIDANMKVQATTACLKMLSGKAKFRTSYEVHLLMDSDYFPDCASALNYDLSSFFLLWKSEFEAVLKGSFDSLVTFHSDNIIQDNINYLKSLNNDINSFHPVVMKDNSLGSHSPTFQNAISITKNRFVQRVGRSIDFCEKNLSKITSSQASLLNEVSALIQRMKDFNIENNDSPQSLLESIIKLSSMEDTSLWEMQFADQIEEILKLPFISLETYAKSVIRRRRIINFGILRNRWHSARHHISEYLLNTEQFYNRALDTLTRYINMVSIDPYICSTMVRNMPDFISIINELIKIIENSRSIRFFVSNSFEYAINNSCHTEYEDTCFIEAEKLILASGFGFNIFSDDDRVWWSQSSCKCREEFINNFRIQDFYFMNSYYAFNEFQKINTLVSNGSINIPGFSGSNIKFYLTEIVEYNVLRHIRRRFSNFLFDYILFGGEKYTSLNDILHEIEIAVYNTIHEFRLYIEGIILPNYQIIGSISTKLIQKSSTKTIMKDLSNGFLSLSISHLQSFSTKFNEYTNELLNNDYIAPIRDSIYKLFSPTVSEMFWKKESNSFSVQSLYEGIQKVSGDDDFLDSNNRLQQALLWDDNFKMAVHDMLKSAADEGYAKMDERQVFKSTYINNYLRKNKEVEFLRQFKVEYRNLRITPIDKRSLCFPVKSNNHLTTDKSNNINFDLYTSGKLTLLKNSNEVIIMEEIKKLIKFLDSYWELSASDRSYNTKHTPKYLITDLSVTISEFLPNFIDDDLYVKFPIMLTTFFEKCHNHNIIPNCLLDIQEWMKIFVSPLVKFWTDLEPSSSSLFTVLPSLQLCSSCPTEQKSLFVYAQKILEEIKFTRERFLTCHDKEVKFRNTVSKGISAADAKQLTNEKFFDDQFAFNACAGEIKENIGDIIHRFLTFVWNTRLSIIFNIPIFVRIKNQFNPSFNTNINSRYILSSGHTLVFASPSTKSLVDVNLEAALENIEEKLTSLSSMDLKDIFSLDNDSTIRLKTFDRDQIEYSINRSRKFFSLDPYLSDDNLHQTTTTKIINSFESLNRMSNIKTKKAFILKRTKKIDSVNVLLSSKIKTNLKNMNTIMVKGDAEFALQTSDNMLSQFSWDRNDFLIQLHKGRKSRYGYTIDNSINKELLLTQADTPEKIKPHSDIAMEITAPAHSTISNVNFGLQSIFDGSLKMSSELQEIDEKMLDIFGDGDILTIKDKNASPISLESDQQAYASHDSGSHIALNNQQKKDEKIQTWFKMFFFVATSVLLVILIFITLYYLFVKIFLTKSRQDNPSNVNDQENITTSK